MRTWLITAGLLVSFVGTALADPAPRFRLNPELVDRFADLERMKQKPDVRIEQVRVNDSELPMTVEGKVVDAMDGTVLLAIDLTREQLEAMESLPYRKVIDRAEVGHHTIYRGRLHIRYTVVDSGTELENPAEDYDPLAKLVGMQVVLHLQPTTESHWVATKIERKP